MGYARKVDVNHGTIRDKLRKVPGVYVKDVSGASGIGFDLIVRYQLRPPVMIEIKADDKQPLTESERKAQAAYGDYWHRVETFEAALVALGISADRPPF